MNEPIRLLVFDLDQTLIPDDELAGEAALASAKVHAPEVCDPARLADDVGVAAQSLLRDDDELSRLSSSTGVSANECLWALFPDADKNLSRLRERVEPFRLAAWSRALGAQGVADPDLAARLAAAFGVERRALHRRYPETDAALDELKAKYALALLTNGAPSLQREKILGTAMRRWFDHIVICGELGTAKPDPATYAAILQRAGIASSQALMIGDNPINDVSGAQTAGMRAVWVNRGLALPAGVAPDAVIDHVGQLPKVLQQLADAGI